MNERWRKLNANMHQYVPFRANMGQHCSLSAVQRKTAFLEQSWWPEFDMFGSMPWCSFPWHKLLPRLTPKSCYKVYSLNLIDEFTSLFSPKVIVAGLPRESFPTEACLCVHECFSVVAQAMQDSPKARPRKNFIEQLKLLLKWMLIERWRPSMLSSMCQHVARLRFDSCAEKDNFSGTGMMAWILHAWINAMVFVPISSQSFMWKVCAHPSCTLPWKRV